MPSVPILSLEEASRYNIQCEQSFDLQSLLDHAVLTPCDHVTCSHGLVSHAVPWMWYKSEMI